MAQTIREQVERLRQRLEESEDSQECWLDVSEFFHANADLFAAAQETAGERDALAAYAAKLREALDGVKFLVRRFGETQQTDKVESALSLTPPDAVAKRSIEQRRAEIAIPMMYDPANAKLTAGEITTKVDAALAAKQEGP